MAEPKSFSTAVTLMLVIYRECILFWDCIAIGRGQKKPDGTYCTNNIDPKHVASNNYKNRIQ
jgi:hypothetical protein